jgi:hypothetical protein
MIAYKLFRLRKDGTLGPLFINRRQKLVTGETYLAESHPTKGYALRPGWHCCKYPSAPHLSKVDRRWCEVSIKDYTKHIRPESQGGVWYTANQMKIIRIM